MNDNIRQNIIEKAWDIIDKDSKIKKLFFLPGFLSIMFLTIILVYQAIYTYLEVLHQEDRILRIILSLFHSGYLTEIIIGLLVFLIIYIIVMPLCEGMLISYISKKEKGNTDISVADSFGEGLYRFLPLFEFGNIFSQFKFISVINIYLFCLRFIGLRYILHLSIAFIFLLMISTVVNVLFAYSKFEIVLNNKSALESMSESIKISILNLSTTIKLYFYMFLLNIRIIINFFVFLVFPFFIATAVTYITTKVFLIITTIALSTIFFVLIIILGYLGGVFEILKTSIWYFAYVEGKKKLFSKDNDKIT